MHSKSQYRLQTAVLFLLLALAVLLRFSFLDARTIHIDEGVTLLYGEQVAHSVWVYNPYNAHGPGIFMLSAIDHLIAPDNVLVGRATMTLVSLVTIFFLWMLYRPLLRTPGRLLLIAGLGLSSGMVFFARYFIHEHLFILATVLTLAAAERWIRHRDSWSPAAFVIGCVVMYAIKETALLTWLAWCVAALLLLLEPKRQESFLSMHWRSVGIGLVIGIILHAALYTLFFIHPGSFVDSFTGPLNWFGRSQQMHVRTFPYFLDLLAVHEYPLVIGAVASVWLLTSLGRWSPRLIFFALWFCVITLLYSVIPYKTPWCIPNMVLPLTLFVAFAFDAVWPLLTAHSKRWWAAIAIVLLACGTLTAWGDSVVHPDRVQTFDYAYLQSDQSFRRFIRTIEDVSNLSKRPSPMPLQVVGKMDELIVVLTKQYQVYGTDEPLQPGLPLYINYDHDDRETLEELEQASGKRYIRSTYRYLRDWGNVIDLFVEEDLWDRYLTEVAHEPVLLGDHPLYDYSN